MRYREQKESLIRVYAGAALLACSLLTPGVTVLAQQSVEKAETSQQVKELAAEGERAKVAVEKGEMRKPAPPEAGTQWGIYSTRSSMELGYRFENTGGNRERFLSDVNVRDGFRLLDYSLDMRARPGTGILFDFMKVDVNNAGGDVAQNTMLRLEKHRVYQFDANVRRFNYFRTLGPEFALGYRNHDLRQQVSDYRLRLLPQRAVRLNLGYGRSMARGRWNPTYSYESDMFQLLGDARWQTDDFTAGLEADWKGWNFGVETFYREFRNDPTINSRPGLDTGFGQPAPRPGAISSLDRDVPLRSRAIVTRANVRGSISERLHVIMRGFIDDERMRAPYYEISTGIASNNSTILEKKFIGNGDIERPGRVFDAGVSLDLNKHWTLTNSFNYTSWKIEGGVATSTTSLTQNAAGARATAISLINDSRLTDLTSYRNILDLSANYGKRLFGNIGWRTQKREVTLSGLNQSGNAAGLGAVTFVGPESESIRTDSFNGGVRLRPFDRTTLALNYERGESNNAFVRINPLEHTRVRARAQFQVTDSFSLNTTLMTLDRRNPTPQVLNNSDIRAYAVSGSYDRGARVGVDAGYDYHDITSVANLRYFDASRILRSGRSLYFSRMHSLFLNTRFGLTERMDFMLYYYYIVDRGASTAVASSFDIVNVYPLRRHNPEARISYRFTNHVTGNLSYRHFSYNEDLFSFTDYRSNIMTTSLRFTF
ncbi:MAG: hypothetical protein ACK562_02125 [Acidobacteriota bacterium]